MVKNDLMKNRKNFVFEISDNIQRITETKNSTTKEITPAINNRNQYTRFDTLNLSYDSNGNLRQKGNQSFAYDYKNQLVKYSDSDKIVEFRYDPFGRRISKQFTANSQQQARNITMMDGM